jgi:hypothetical protein
MSAEAALVKLERQVLGVARVSSFLDAVERLRRMLAAEDPRLRAEVLKLVAPSIGRDLAAAIGSAFNIGIKDAVSVIGEGGPKGTPKKPPAGLGAAARSTEKAIAAEIAKARKLAHGGADAATVLSPVLAASNMLTRDVVTLVNHAGNAGTTAVADAAGLATVWVAETNACVQCLAYSGRVAKPGKTFPGGISYGKRTSAEPISHPPRHPHCRCTVEPLRSKDYAEALRREADRSVLRGFSLESESMKTRVDAAARLIENGVDAPKSVVAFARRAIKAGEFPTRGRP